MDPRPKVLITSYIDAHGNDVKVEARVAHGVRLVKQIRPSNEGESIGRPGLPAHSSFPGGCDVRPGQLKPGIQIGTFHSLYLTQIRHYGCGTCNV
jgi:hypothetical protein